MHRPSFHFQPPSHWMNDPNGLILYRGEIHLFYQYNPFGDSWGTIHWGHAKSTDGVHWTHLPIALAPSTERGEIHCFSGCCVLSPQGIPTILYTSIGRDEDHRDCFGGAQQWLAESHDGLLTWTKPDFNPILNPSDHPGFIPTDWRDPYVWKDGDTYWMTLGAGDRVYGYVYLYRSKDLRQWTYVSELAKRKVPLIECPNLIDFGSKQILMYSPGDGVIAEIGTLQDHRFIPETTTVVDYGKRANYYAPQILQLSDQKLVFGWIPEDDRRDFPISGYNGALALPRTLTLIDGIPHYQPLKALETLRANAKHWTRLSLDQATVLRNQPRALEVRFDTDLGSVVVLNLLASPDGKEMNTCIFDFEKGNLLVDRSQSSLSEKPIKSTLQAPIDHRQHHEVIVYLDHSILEIFVNETTCLTARIYPTLKDANGLAVVGSGILDHLDVYALTAIA